MTDFRQAEFKTQEFKFKAPVKNHDYAMLRAHDLHNNCVTAHVTISFECKCGSPTFMRGRRGVVQPLCGWVSATVAHKTAPMFEHISNFQLLCDHDISCCYKKY